MCSWRESRHLKLAQNKPSGAIAVCPVVWGGKEGGTLTSGKGPVEHQCRSLSVSAWVKLGLFTRRVAFRGCYCDETCSRTPKNSPNCTAKRSRTGCRVVRWFPITHPPRRRPSLVPLSDTSQLRFSAAWKVFAAERHNLSTPRHS